MQARVLHDKISTINPATGQVIRSYDSTDTQQISQIVSDARTAFEKWKNKDIVERCDYIRSLARVLNKNKDQYAKFITQEMGKPITQSYAEI
jgi:succinate-semialdehyde dehydrogenase / glutarate-semialdehyde dehydrogenase